MVNSYLKSCFLIFPNYNLGHGLMEMAYNEYINEYYAKIGEQGWAAVPEGVGPGPEAEASGVGDMALGGTDTGPEPAAPQASSTR